MEAHEARNKICKILGITVSSILVHTRKREVVDARTIISFILYHKWDVKITYEEIGELIGQDHSVVQHYVKKISKIEPVKSEIKRVVSILKKTSGFDDNGDVNDLRISLYGRKQRFTIKDMNEFANECLIKL